MKLLSTLTKGLLLTILLIFAVIINPYTQNLISIEVEQRSDDFAIAKVYDAFDRSIIKSGELIDEKEITKSTILNLQKDFVESILLTRDNEIHLSIPIEDQKNLELLLYQVNVLSPDFKILRSGGSLADFDPDKSIFYWGIVKNKPNSLVSITISEGEFMGVIIVDNQAYTIGKLENSDKYIIYSSEHHEVAPDFECFVEPGEHYIDPKGENDYKSAADPNNCVQLYIEVRHEIFLNKGSLQNTADYINGLLSQVAIMYANESINISVSTLNIWDTPDPYVGPSTSNFLNEFRNSSPLNGTTDPNNPNFVGNLAHLLGYTGGGGIAYVNVLCNSTYGVAYSDIGSSYNNYPTYSWTVMVFTHEMGHNLGSPHTHSCSWDAIPGNGTYAGSNALDGCGPAAGYSEGCNAPLPPNGQGTVMSYCHLNVGIGLAYGFGEEPGDLIRDRVYNASCLVSCSPPCPDDDNDGVCNENDQCPGTDDSIIGTSCEDGDVCTTGETYDSNCNCSGGVFQDSDGDGVCDANDQCPGFNDALIGQPCNDGQACTSGETWQPDCSCGGGTFDDEDGDGVCDADDQCPGKDDALIGQSCEDGDVCTTGETYDNNCNCSGGTYIDADGDGFCVGNDPDDSDPCNPDDSDPECSNTCSEDANDNFESGWGSFWNDGGGDCTRVNSSTYANSGSYSIRLRDNSGNASALYSDVLAYADVSEINISFSYYPNSMETGEDFFIEVSTNGGSSYTIVQEWNSGSDFFNGNRYFENVTINGPFTNNTRIRIRCDASSNADQVYVDDVVVEACSGSGGGCTDTGNPCDDGDDCTVGETYDSNCNCVGGIYTDADSDGVCVGDDPDDNDACVPDSGHPNCNQGGCSDVDIEGFESGWGIWNDGGSDCRRSSNDAAYANTGTYCVRIRDNSGSISSTYTDNLSLSGANEVNVYFSFITRSMETNEDFFLDISSNGGSSYSPLVSWVTGVDVSNGIRYNASVTITGSFNNTTRLRFRCDASGNSDWVYLDDIRIEACNSAPLVANLGPPTASATLDQGEKAFTNKATITPNPVVSGHTLEVNLKYGIENADIDIFSLTGERIRSMAYNGDLTDHIVLETYDIPQGSYLIRIQTENELMVEKLVIIR